MKKYTHIIIFALITGAIAASIFGVYFIQGKIESTLDEIEKKELEAEIRQEQLKDLPLLEAVHQKIITESPRLDIVYTEDRVVEVIRNIEGIAKAEGLDLTISQKAEEKTKPTGKTSSAEDKKESDKKEEKPATLTDTLPFEKSVRLEIRAKGSYKGIRNFIYKLETAPYALDVLSLDAAIAPLDEEENTTKPTVLSTASDTPFLLKAEEVNQEQTTTAIPEKVIFIINMALYTK